MNSKRIRLMCVTGVFTAIIYVFTAYLHFPTHMGYIHIGDGFIYLAACLLPMPYAIFAGSVGAALADLLSGFAVWAPGTIVIKALAVILFCHTKDKIICRRNLWPLIPAAVICVGGYYLFEVILVGNFVAPLSCIHTNVTQSVLSTATFIITGLALDKMKIKEKI